MPGWGVLCFFLCAGINHEGVSERLDFRTEQWPTDFRWREVWILMRGWEIKYRSYTCFYLIAFSLVTENRHLISLCCSQFDGLCCHESGHFSLSPFGLGGFHCNFSWTMQFDKSVTFRTWSRGAVSALQGGKLVKVLWFTRDRAILRGCSSSFHDTVFSFRL